MTPKEELIYENERIRQEKEELVSTLPTTENITDTGDYSMPLPKPTAATKLSSLQSRDEKKWQKIYQ